MRKEVPTEVIEDFKIKYMGLTFSELRKVYTEWNLDLLIKRLYEKYGKDNIEREKREFKNNRDKQKLINKMWEIYDGGKFPEIRDFTGKYRKIKRVFGSFKNMLKESGIPVPKERLRYFDRDLIIEEEDLLPLVKKFTAETISSKLRYPMRKDVDDCEYLPTSTSIEKRFGSYKNLINLAFGYDISSIERYIEKEKIKNRIIQLSKIIGRTPNSRDLDEYSKKYDYMPSAKAVMDNFGSLVEAQVECGFTEGVYMGRIKTREDLIDDLHNLYLELNRPVVISDLKYNPFMAKIGFYINEFGSWQEALKIANVKGVDAKTKYFTNITKTQVFSWYELDFANFLEENNIEYKNELWYSRIIPTGKRYRFDFLIIYKELVYPVEIFGMEKNKYYSEVMKDKIKLCKENKLPLLTFFPNDFRSKKSLFDIIEIKISQTMDIINNPYFIDKNLIRLNKKISELK